MLKLHNSNHGHIIDGPPIAGTTGLTAADLKALDEVRVTAIARHLWGRGQLVSNEFAHYLAVWRPGADAAETPGLALARFKNTGTYMLMIGGTVVASGSSLSDVLPALPYAIARSDRWPASNAAD